ncbi:hypothetical protein VC83_09509 [Pseudogymnoascus destructans]|uniref:Uncharacterized protein n=1 Tax=Pseudogymnoascus destructans TaxID=655981 RepID=A0A176ZW66_9PEZI|nr:uncharacterized protein VC83_09509 [Pseudogymnoascus destructans]OAF54226.1 hypothetical protein VC83_09509 [Pseudogymnoascus destructans]
MEDSQVTLRGDEVLISVSRNETGGKWQPLHRTSVMYQSIPLTQRQALSPHPPWSQNHGSTIGATDRETEIGGFGVDSAAPSWSAAQWGGTEEIVDKSVNSYELPEVKLFRIGTDTHLRQYVEKADIKHTQDNDGQLPRMTTRQTTTAATTAVPSEDIPSRMAHLEAQIQEVKDLLVILTAAQTRIPSTVPVDATIPTVEATEQ